MQLFPSGTQHIEVRYEPPPGFTEKLPAAEVPSSKDEPARPKGLFPSGSRRVEITYQPPPYSRSTKSPEPTTPKNEPAKDELRMVSAGANKMCCPYCRRRVPFLGILNTKPASCCFFSCWVPWCPFKRCYKPDKVLFQVQCQRCGKTSLNFDSDSRCLLLPEVE